MDGVFRTLYLRNLLDAAQLTALKAQLAATIDAEHDSVRFYRLGNSYKERIDVLGCTARIEAGELLMLWRKLKTLFSAHVNHT